MPWHFSLVSYKSMYRFHDMKKEVVIYDCADLNVAMLSKMYRRRLSGYRTIGYKVE